MIKLALMIVVNVLGCPPECLLLGFNGECDLICNSPSCFYDNGECFGCSLGCLEAMVSDGVCQGACYVPECEYDGIDCVDMCKHGCSPDMIGDGNCDSACNTESCDFDGGDCYEQCSPGCYSYMIGDELCETECITDPCGYDFDDCQSSVWVQQGSGGDGSESSPFSSLEEALESVVSGVVSIYILEGTYYFNRSLTLDANAAVFIYGLGSVEFRYLSPNVTLEFSNLLAVAISNITFDGSELWMQGCDSDACRFVRNWLCDANACYNSQGQSVPQSSIYVQNYWKYCYNPLINFFTLNSVATATISNINLQNSDFIGSLVKSNQSSLAVHNIHVAHCVMMSNLIQAYDIQEMYNHVYNLETQYNIPINMYTSPFAVSLKNVWIHDVNRIDTPTHQGCKADYVPGVLSSSGIDKIDINTVYINNSFSNTDNSPTKGIIDITGSTHFTIQNIYLSSNYLETPVFNINYIINFLKINKNLCLIQNAYISNSYITTSLIRVYSEVLTANITVNNFYITTTSLINAPILNNTSLYKLCRTATFFSTKFSMSYFYVKLSKFELSNVFADRIHLIGNLVYVYYSTHVVISGLNVVDLSDTRPPYLIGDLGSYYNKSFSPAIVYPANSVMVYVDQSACVELKKLYCDFVGLNDSMVLLSNINGNYMVSDSVLLNSKAYSGAELVGDFNSCGYYSNVSIINSDFVNSGILLTGADNVLIDRLFVTGLKSTAINSSIKFLSIKNSLIIENNSSSPMIILSPVTSAAFVSISQTKFNKNKGTSSVDLHIISPNNENFNINISDTIFSETIGISPVSVKIQDGSVFGTILFKNVTIDNIISTDCNLYLDSGILSFNLKQGYVKFDGCFFNNNQISVPGSTDSLVFHQNDLSQPVEFSNCVIYNNTQYAFLLQSNLLITQYSVFYNSTYQYNSASLISSYNCDLTVNSSSFLSNYHINTLILINEKSRVAIVGSLFQNNAPRQLGSLLEVLNADYFTLQSNKFIGNYYKDSFLVFLQETNGYISDMYSYNNTVSSAIGILLTNLTILQIKANKDKCTHYIYIVNSELTLSNNTFTEIDTILESNDNKLNIVNTLVQNSNTQVLSSIRDRISLSSISIKDSYGAFTLESSKVYIKDFNTSNYYNNIEFLDSDVSFTTGMISNSNSLIFTNSFIQAFNVAVYCSSSMVINNSTGVVSHFSFIDNQDTGLKLSYSSIGISNSMFNRNKGVLGGGVYLASSLVTINNSNFYDNAALEGGGVYLDSANISQSNNSYNNNQAVHGANIAGTPKYLAQDPNNSYIIVSGNQVSNLIFYVSDQFDQIIYSDNSSYVSVTTKSNNTYIKGTTEILSNAGTISLNNLVFYNPPGTNASILIKNEEVELEVELVFRSCYIGEVELSDFSCKACDNNTYSLDIHDQYCKPCPDTAVCFGTDRIYSASGYWRDIAYPENFYPCLNKHSCIQGSESLKSNCEYSYSGILCASCIDGYSLKGAYLCSKCPEYWVSLTIIIIASGIILGLIIFLVYSNIKNLNKQKSSIALLVKILLNYCQTIMLLASIDLKWSQSILYLFDFSTIIGDSSNQVFSSTCSNDISDKNGQSLTSAWITVVFPFVIAILSFIIWGLVSILKKTLRYIQVHFMSTLIVLVILLHTSISNTLLSLLSCKSINGKYYNTVDYNSECFAGPHLETLYNIGLPGIVFWCFTIPFFIFYRMFANRARLDEHDTKIKYKTLFAGYTDKFYYWEFYIILRKFCVKLMALILVSTDVTVQGLGIMMVLVFALVAHLKYNPYEKEEINRLEFYSIMTLIIFVAGGIVFSTGISDYSKEAIGWGLFSLNILFLSYWSRFFFYASFQIFKSNNFFMKISAKISQMRAKRVHPELDKKIHSGANADSKKVENFVENGQSDHLFPENPQNSCDTPDKTVPRVGTWSPGFQ